MYVGFIHVLLPQFLTNGLVNVLLFELGLFSVSLGMIDAHVWDDC